VKLKHHRRELELCTYCPKLCRFACPVAEVERRETVTPWAKMSLAGMVRNGRLELDDDVAEVMYHCLGCQHCYIHCRHGVDVPTTLVAGRRLAVELGVAPEPVQQVVDRLQAGADTRGNDLRQMLDAEADAESRQQEAQAVLFAGCRLLARPGSLRRHLQVLGRLGIDYLAVFDAEPLCCGLPYWWAGDHDAFRQQARRLARRLGAYRRVVCPCPSCAMTLRLLYPQVDATPAPEVLHLVELLAPQVEKNPPPQPLAGSFVFHHPCTLARHLELEQIVDQLLGRLLAEPLASTSWSGKDTFCCGGGGLVPEMLPEVATQVAARRMTQLEASGAGQVISSCPGCLDQLESVPDGLETLDLIEVVARAYGM